MVHVAKCCGAMSFKGSTRLTSTDHLCIRGWNAGILGQGANDPGRNAESVWILMLVTGKEGRPESLAKGAAAKANFENAGFQYVYMYIIYVYIYIHRIIMYFCFRFLPFLPFPT